MYFVLYFIQYFICRMREEETREELAGKSLIYQLCNAVFLALIARTEFICYFTMILCHLCYGNIMSLVLPLIAMGWGMLSLPRPAKTFWICVLSYVMVSYTYAYQPKICALFISICNISAV